MASHLWLWNTNERNRNITHLTLSRTVNVASFHFSARLIYLNSSKFFSFIPRHRHRNGANRNNTIWNATAKLRLNLWLKQFSWILREDSEKISNSQPTYDCVSMEFQNILGSSVAKCMVILDPSQYWPNYLFSAATGANLPIGLKCSSPWACSKSMSSPWVASKNKKIFC